MKIQIIQTGIKLHSLVMCFIIQSVKEIGPEATGCKPMIVFFFPIMNKIT